MPSINASMKEAGIEWGSSITHRAGDATQFAAVSGLIGSQLPLAILPGGSANVLATELGIPTELKEACALLGRATKNKFGCYGEVLDKVPHRFKVVPGAIRVLLPDKKDDAIE